MERPLCGKAVGNAGGEMPSRLCKNAATYYCPKSDTFRCTKHNEDNCALAWRGGHIPWDKAPEEALV